MACTDLAYTLSRESFQFFFKIIDTINVVSTVVMNFRLNHVSGVHKTEASAQRTSPTVHSVWQMCMVAS